jgi:uncharacterized protein YdeI (YjbR/CyaY-like superfamily)
MGANDEPLLEFPSPDGWAAWLAAHHIAARGAWLRIAKQGAPRSTITYAEALDVAICYGWIDGQKGAIDRNFWRQRFTPRGPRSKWSRINTEHAERLIAEGRMAPAGLAAIAAAKADGRWEDAYEPQSRAEPPADFLLALGQSPAAKEFFDTLTGAARYAFIYRLGNVKRVESRQRRIAEYVRMLEHGRTLGDD